MEAMAAKLPVIATSVGGTPELVVHNKTGFLVPAENTVALAEALVAMIILEQEERIEMGLAGHNRVVEEFNISKMINNYSNLYLECLKIWQMESGLDA